MASLSRRRLASYIAAEYANGASAASLARQAAAYLADHGRLDDAELLTREIAALLAQNYGHVAAEVTTAGGLDGELRGQVRLKLQNAYSAQSAELAEHTDESLIGGMVLRTPDAELDTSVRSQLRALRNNH